MQSTLLLAAPFVLALSLSAQSVRELGFQERLDVPEVRIELFVTDVRGQPVTDLRRDQVTVYEDGAPVELGFFEYVGEAEKDERTATRPALPSERADGPAGSPPPARVVLFFDELSPGSSDRLLALRAVRSFLSEQLPAGAEVLIASFDGGLRIPLPFSRDTKEVLAAFDSSALRLTPRRLTAERDRMQVMERIFEDAETGPCLYGLDYARAFAESQHHEGQRTLAALSEMVDSLSGLDGRKVVFYIGEGVPMRPGEEAFLLYRDPAPARELVYEIEMELDPGEYRIAAALRDELSGETSFVGLDLDASR